MVQMPPGTVSGKKSHAEKEIWSDPVTTLGNCKVLFLIGFLLAFTAFFIHIFTTLTRIELVNTSVCTEFSMFKTSEPHEL